MMSQAIRWNIVFPYLW